MKTFQKFCESMHAYVSVDMSQYKQMLRSYLQEMAHHQNDYAQNVRDFKFNLDDFRHTLRKSGFPEAEELLQDIRSGRIKEHDVTWGWYKKLSEYYFADRAKSDFDTIRNLQHQLRMYSDQLSNQKLGFTDEDLEQTFNEILGKTEVQLRKTVSLIQSAISRIEDWNGSKLVVTINTPYDINDQHYDWLEAQGDGVHVELETPGNVVHYKPGFTLFTGEEGTEIGDILDASDTEFFRSPESTSDYFNLISEIRQPGSSGGSKVIKLYTARPYEDRALYMQAKQTKHVPTGLWATTSYQRAVGLSTPGELGTSDSKPRDVYEIGVSSKHLILHYDGGSFKDYQLFSKTGQVPVISIRHVH